MNQSVIRQKQQDLAHLRPDTNDEIDLGQLIRNLLAQWKLISAITALGAITSIFYALSTTSIFKVEAIISIPTATQLGTATEQSLIPISPEDAFIRVVTEASRASTQQTAFLESELNTVYASLSPDTNYNPVTAFSNLRGQIKIEKLVYEFNELSRDQVAPLTDAKVIFNSAYPEASVDLLTQMLDLANTYAVSNFQKEVLKTKAETLQDLKKQLESLTVAAGESREAKILRMTEANELKIGQITQKMNALLENAKQDRLNRIVQLEEALATAKTLNITEPVTWDDLRPNQRSSQITNELGETTKSSPLYFQGSRILAAEIQRLQSRTDDRPFINEYNQLAQQIVDLKNDPEIEALKNRTDDSIYIESFDTLKDKISSIESEPTSFANAQFSQVTLQPLVPVNPIAPNRKLIVVAGTVLAGFFGLFIALIRIAIPPKDNV